MMNKYQSIVCVFVGLGIIAGAFGAHALGDTLEPRYMDAFKTGVHYHLINSVGALLVSVLTLPESTRKGAIKLLLLGCVLFSGSLYTLSINPKLGIITPFGGTLFIAAWVYLAWALWRSHEH